ncbi:retrovirus-related pol polyprotein from transposon TNT 1-94 [Tanacetum coccineum]
MDVVFNKSLVYKDTLKGVGTADFTKEVEFEVELQGSRVKLTMDPHAVENLGNEDEEQDNEEPQQQNLDNYVLVRDRAKRTTTISQERIEGVQKPRYKAKLVARGITQRARIDYNEIFSHVVRHTSIRVILSLTACEDYELEQLDLKTAFLHGNLEETIYTRQPPGFEEGMGNKLFDVVRNNVFTDIEYKSKRYRNVLNDFEDELANLV